MTWILLIIFLLLVVPSELYIYRKEIAHRRKRDRNIYGWVTIGIWGITLLGDLTARFSEVPYSGAIRFFEAFIVLFLFNGAAKVIFALVTAIGRRTKAMSFFYALAAVLIIVLNLIMTYAATTGRWTLREERVDISSCKIPESFSGFRIVVFSDIHAGRLLDRTQILGDMVRKINSLDADIVVNCGDLVNNDYGEIDQRTIDILSGINARYGIFSVLGNHDMGKYIQDTLKLPKEENLRILEERVSSMGWQTLRNESVPLINASDTVYITGIDFPSELMRGRSSHRKLEGDQDYDRLLASVPRDKFNITASHAPQAWEQLLQTGKSDLTVAGHVHSMQMKIKLPKGRKWSPARLLYKEWSGLYCNDGDYLYVNDGIGYAILPMRIWCKPEITVIELRRDENNCVCGCNI